MSDRLFKVTGNVLAREEDKKEKKEQINGILTVDIKAPNIVEAIQQSEECGLDPDSIQSAVEFEEAA